MSERTPGTAGASGDGQTGSDGPRLTVFAEVRAMSAAAAGAIGEALEQARTARGVAHLALSGGGTPVGTYEMLGSRLAAGGSGSVQGLEIWFADERCVGPEDEESNYRMASQTLLGPAGIPAAQVHRMEGERGPEEGARLYAEQLAERVASEPAQTGGAPGGPSALSLPVLDLVVLGIGPDGHIASLFPEAVALRAAERELCLGVHDSPKPPPERITLSLSVLRRARRNLLLASGSEKAGALARAFGASSERTPASLLPRETLHVIADEAAAAELDHGPSSLAS